MTLAKSGGLKPNRALAVFAIALEVADRLNDKKLQAATHYEIGLAHSTLGEVMEAIGAYERSKNLFKEVGARRDLLYILGDLSTLHFVAQDYASARDCAEQSLALAETLKGSGDAAGAWPDEYGIAGALSTLGLIRQREGNHAQAEVLVRKALELYEALDGGSGKFAYYVADCVEALGRIAYSAGDTRRAFLHYNRALEVAKSSRRLDREASVLNSLGVLYLEQEDYAKAEDCLSRGLQIYVARGDRRECARVLLNLSVVHQRRGEYDRALEKSLASYNLAAGVADRELAVASLEAVGTVHLETGHFADALGELDRGLSLAETIGDQTRVAEISWRMAQAYSGIRDYGMATPLLERAIAIARELRLTKLLYLATTTLGSVYRDQGKDKLAIETLARAVSLIEAMRASAAGNEQGRQIFFQHKVPPYHMLIELLAARGQTSEALGYAELAKARVLLDSLGRDRAALARAVSAEERREGERLDRAITDLNRQLREERLKPEPDREKLKGLAGQLDSARLKYAAFQDLLHAAHEVEDQESGPAVPSTAQTLTGLDRRTAVLEYVVAEDKIHLFVLTRREGRGEVSLSSRTINLGRSGLAEKVEAFHRLMAARLPAFDRQSRELYDLLIKPAAPLLRGADTLCVIPDGALWELPFQALRSGRSRYLVEDFSIYFAPSLGVLNEMGRKAAAGGLRPRSLLALGNPAAGGEGSEGITDSLHQGDFAALPEAEAEVGEVGRFFGRGRKEILTRARATEAAFKSLAPSYGAIHFAAHGVLDNLHPFYSHLVLSTSGGGDDDGLLEAREIMNLDLGADLVVLSSCETARGKVSAGEGMIGMSWAFFAAGCRTVVASQWKVSSGGTSRLMAGFYRALGAASETRGKAGALREAALSLMKNTRYRHPFYWAGFVLVGSNE